MKLVLIHILFNQIPIREIISLVFCQNEIIAGICLHDLGLEYRCSDKSFSIKFFNEKK